MINLIQNSAHLILREHGKYASNCGVLNTPFSGYDMRKVADLGMRWAMDNGCFKRYDPPAIMALLRNNAGIPGCLFMVAPDVVQNHEATLKRFWLWQGIIRDMGYPVAFVLQNGVSIKTVPWGFIDAIFIGGSTEFKFWKSTTEICYEAEQRELWIHQGRVNTPDGIAQSKKNRAKSFDGTGFSRYMKSMVSHNLRHYATNYIDPNYERTLI